MSIRENNLIQTEDRKNRNLIKNLVLTIVYAIFTLFIVLHHEIWADEAQVWLICKNLNVFELFKHLVNEGHPAFFYLLIMPFAKILHGTSAIFSMQLICWFSSTIAVFLLWHFSPFNKRTKAAITLSAGFLYFMPVIARSYSVLPLLIFAAAILFKHRKNYPLIYGLVLSLTVATHSIMFCFVFLTGVYQIIENIKQKSFDIKNNLSITMIFSTLIYVILQLAGTFKSNEIISFSVNNVLNSTVRVFVQFFTNSVNYWYSLLLSHSFMPEHLVLYFVCSAVFMVLFFILIFNLFFLNKKIFSICFLSIAFQFFVYIFAYSAMIYPSRVFVSFLIIIFSYWIVFENEENIGTNKVLNFKNLNILLCIFFIITIPNGVRFTQKDINYNYSSAKETAEFIERNTDKNALLIPFDDTFVLALRYYLPQYHFYSIYKNRELDYMVWYQNKIYLSDDRFAVFNNVLEHRLKDMNTKEKIYIVFSDFSQKGVLEKKYPQKYKPIFSSKPSLAIGEGFVVYEYVK